MDSSQQNGSEIARMIWIVGSPIIFTVGVFGNVMTIIVLSNKRNKKTSSSIFLTFLAVADLLVMTIMLPRWWLIYLFDFDVRHIHNIMCKIQFFASHVSSAWSANLLAAVTIERTICTVKPYRVKTLCTIHIAVIISVILALTFFAIHGHVLVGIKLYEVSLDEDTTRNLFPTDSNEKSNKKCKNILDMIFTSKDDDFDQFVLEENCNSLSNSSAKEERVDDYLVSITQRQVGKIKMCWYNDESYGNYFSGIHQIVNTVSYLIIPETVFFVGDIIIARSLRKSRTLRARMTTEYMRTKPGFDNRAKQITLTLLLVNIVFVLTTTPVNVFLIGRSSWIDKDTGMSVTQEIVWAVVNMMYYSNHSINFILYFLSGYRFRRQVLETFKCIKTSSVDRGKSLSLNQKVATSISSDYDLNLKVKVSLYDNLTLASGTDR